jgi:anti-sigma B factor antagonist
MKLNITSLDGITIVAPLGRFLGNQDSDDFAASIRNSLNRGDMKILIDLAAVDYINSMGLGAIFAGYITAAKAGAKYALANVNVRIAEMMTVTGTDTIIPICATVEEARKSLAE